MAPKLVGLGLAISHPAQARLSHNSGYTASTQEVLNWLTRYSLSYPLSHGQLKWKEVTLPDDYDVVNQYMKEPIPKGYLDEWLKYTDSGLLVVEKD